MTVDAGIATKSDVRSAARESVEIKWQRRWEAVTLNSEMDFYLRNGRNGDFFTKWSYKIQFYSLSGTTFYVNIKVRHAYHLIVLFQVF